MKCNIFISHHYSIYGSIKPKWFVKHCTACLGLIVIESEVENLHQCYTEEVCVTSTV
jgi:hypothetical protein